MHGGKTSSVITFTSKDLIDTFFNKQNECIIKYDVLHPLLKISQLNEGENSEYIIEASKDHDVSYDEYEREFGNKISVFINIFRII